MIDSTNHKGYIYGHIYNSKAFGALNLFTDAIYWSQPEACTVFIIDSFLKLYHDEAIHTHEKTHTPQLPSPHQLFTVPHAQTSADGHAYASYEFHECV